MYEALFNGTIKVRLMTESMEQGQGPNFEGKDNVTN